MITSRHGLNPYSNYVTKIISSYETCDVKFEH